MALEEEAEHKVDKVRQMEVWLDDEFARSLWLGDVSLRIQKTSVLVTNYWLEEEFKNSSQKEGRFGVSGRFIGTISLGDSCYYSLIMHSHGTRKV